MAILSAEDKLEPGSFDLIVFDLDNTLAKSKMPLDGEMAELLRNLLKVKKVSVASGASFDQYQQQFISHLDASPELLANLYLLPTSGAKMFEYKDNDWRQVYSNDLDVAEKEKIMAGFEQAFKETNLPEPEQVFGQLLEDRGTQITFSGLGSEAPLELKKAWDPDRRKKEALALVLRRDLPEFSVKIGGLSSIDVTKKGIDKAYGLKRLTEYLAIPISRMVYVGDELSSQGNDAPALGLGGICVAVPGGPEDTKRLLRNLLVL